MPRHVKATKIPAQTDFTGGLGPSLSCSYVGTTGDQKLDERLMELAVEIGGEERACLLAEMMTTAVRMSKGGTSFGDFKMANRALKELREASEVFHPYEGCRKVAVFGSARTKPEEEEYQTAVRFSRTMRDHGFMTITGAGPGIMAAGNEGAGRDDSFGLNITLPFEAAANEFIAGDEKLIDFNYFFTRKLSFVKEADAAVGLPGGFGTMDEVFEALTLIQTGKAVIYPIVLLDAKGGKYWKFWDQFIREHLSRLGLISDSDFALYKVTDDIDEAVEEIVGFYRNFHSYRYVGDRLVIRMVKELSADAVKSFNEDFADCLKSGEFVQQGALEEEAGEEELADLPRLVFRHRRRNFGRLRQLIDAVNVAETR
ncbi:MAG: LOG family protein [Verrucomicrobiales bacterium]